MNSMHFLGWLNGISGAFWGRRAGRGRRVGAVALLVLAGGIFPGQAQWLTQTNVIAPGWNAVYLFVDASGQSLDTLITANVANPIDQVWEWNVAPSPAQYVSTPANLLATGSQWLDWIRFGGATGNGLVRLSPNTAYLVHSTAATNFTWTVQGQPVPPSYNWDVTGVNLIGFPTPAISPPSFQNFFAYAPGLAGFPIYSYPGLDPTSYVPQQQLSLPAAIVRGQAYWVGSPTGSNNSYFGPFQIILPNPSGIDFTNTGTQVSLHIANTTAASLSVKVQLAPSEVPLYGSNNLAGMPPVLIRGANINATNLTYSCLTLGGGNAPATANSPAATNQCSWTLAPRGQPGSDAVIVLGINRYAMGGAPGTEYAGILRFTDSLGLSEVDVPVAAAVSSTAGLWVGGASVTQVGSYLKTYATNANGSLAVRSTTLPPGGVALATNGLIVLTNAWTFYSTNLVVTNYSTTGWVTTCVTTNNTVVGTSLVTNAVVATNGLAVVTNKLISTTAYSATIITLDLAPPYYDQDEDGNFYWVTALTTNTTLPVVATTNTNWLGTNTVAPVAANGTPVPTFSLQVSSYSLTNLVVTNALFASPVTNSTVVHYAVTNQVPCTVPAYDVCTTNLAVTAILATNVWSSTVLTSKSLASLASYTNVLQVFTNSSLFTVTQGMQAVTENLKVFRNFATNLVLTNYVVYNLVTYSNALGASITSSVTGTTAWITTNRSGQATSAMALIMATNIFQTVTTNLPGSYVVTGINTNLGPTMSAYPLRRIFFCDGTNCSLLQHVYWGVNPDTNYIVSTVQSALDQTKLASARRISATDLPWTANNAPWPFTGQLAQGGMVSGTVTDPYDDQASNPFLHTYHPDHNNLTADFSQELPRGAQSYDIVRTITLSMSPPGLDFTSLTSAGGSLSGAYFETINLVGGSGATRTFNVAGSFVLNQISTIGMLTVQ